MTRLAPTTSSIRESVDHRLGKKTKQIKRIMKGELDLLLD